MYTYPAPGPVYGVCPSPSSPTGHGLTVCVCTLGVHVCRCRLHGAGIVGVFAVGGLQHDGLAKIFGVPSLGGPDAVVKMYLHGCRMFAG